MILIVSVMHCPSEIGLQVSFIAIVVRHMRLLTSVDVICNGLPPSRELLGPVPGECCLVHLALDTCTALREGLEDVARWNLLKLGLPGHSACKETALVVERRIEGVGIHSLSKLVLNVALDTVKVGDEIRDSLVSLKLTKIGVVQLVYLNRIISSLDLPLQN